jgi:hypothetical protein
MLVQALVAQTSVEGFDVGILVRLVRFDQSQYQLRLRNLGQPAASRLLDTVLHAFVGPQSITAL